MTRTEGPLILGGGLAGSMAALELARAGRSVTLLEKSTGPHDKVCGEFLSRESLLYFERHRIDPGALGGMPIDTVRLVTSKFSRESALPFAAWSLTRRTLDEEMLRLAAQSGVQVVRGTCVTALERQRDRWSVSFQNDEAMQADNLFLATGKHNLPGWTRPAGRQSDLVAFKMYYRLTARQHQELGRAVELVLFPGGYAGLQPVENGVVNLCLLIQSNHLKHTGAPWAGVLQHVLRHSPHLEKRLGGAAPLLQKPLAASRIPYGHLETRQEDGLWRIGDQAAVIPSFCGDGMAIALHSGALAAAHFLQGSSAPVYQIRLYHQLRRRMGAATRLSQVLVGFPLAAQLLRLFPYLLPAIALMTRIPNKALAAVERMEG